ncbi:MAG: riboflavin kinase [Candidatus Daviesbacteria bacterium]|nr:riboflavin kinase [Candidatus Daviesbacteria bacterium]
MIKIQGRVKKGFQRGKNLGFPTANVAVKINIEEGIYISRTTHKKIRYFSLTFIGEAETFQEKLFQVETYILDFNSNLYNQWISVELIKKIRGNRKFRSVEDLVRQMKKDELVARGFFNMVV